MTHVVAPPLSAGMHIPSPPVSGFHIGPLFIHFYALMYLVGIVVAIIVTRRRVAAAGGDPELVYDLAMWTVPAGIIGGRIYFDITTPEDIPHVWYGVFAVWQGGLGIWGAVALAALVGAWRVRRHGASVSMFMDAVAPALLLAQGIGRIGNYFNNELFGRPTRLPWGLEVPLAYRPPGYAAHATFHPSFLYELIWDCLLAGLIIWLGHHRNIKQQGQFALYVTGYSAYRIFEESIRIDSSQHFLGLRLNMFVACALTLAGAIWFVVIQRRNPPQAVAAGGRPGEPGSQGAEASHAGADAGIGAGQAGVPGDQAGVPGDQAGVPGGQAGVPGGQAGVPGGQAAPGAESAAPAGRASPSQTRFVGEQAGPGAPDAG